MVQVSLALFLSALQPFGIKGSYAGQSAVMQPGKMTVQEMPIMINDAFRSYPSYYESLQDYVAALKQGHFCRCTKSNTSITRMQQQR